jgi:hypothetical protein
VRRLLSTAIAVVFLSGLGGGFASAATRCRDASGKFTKCVKATPAPKAAKCRDAKGKFTKCPK